jgi:hypothetical protein
LDIKVPSLYHYVDGLDGLLKEISLHGLNLLYERLVDAAIGVSGDKAVMQLAEQGKVDIDASADTYLQAPIEGRVTIRNLLNHTSGLLTSQTREDLTVHDTFGTHVYANINYTLLGDVVEAVSVVRILMGMEAEGISQSDYIIPHLLIDLVCLLLLAISIFPLLMLRCWYRKLGSRKPRVSLIAGLLLHLAYPLLLLSVPPLLRVQYFVAWAFAPDFLLVLICAAILALLCGAAKLILRGRRRGQPDDKA